MAPPEMRQAGGGPTIYCDWCHLPASFVWSNRDPGVVDDNREINPHWPIEVDPVTPTCARCEALIDDGQVIEMMQRALQVWVSDFTGGKAGLGWEPRPGWRLQAWDTMVACVSAWLSRRDAVGEIPWEEVPE